MAFFKYLCLLASVQTALCTSLIDFSAARADNPSILGIINLEAARGNTSSTNTDDLYIKLGTDPNGTAALHCHRIENDIRTEYHSLSGKTSADETYYIGYQFSLGETEDALMIWQFKEYAANNAADGGANIPLSLEFQNGVLNFQYQSSYSTGREPQWSKAVDTNTVYSVGIIINTATPGWVEFYFDGVLQTFSTSGTTKLSATTFPGQTEPKFGAYRGEAVGIDTYIYRIQIGTALSDIEDAAGLSTSTTTTTTTTKATTTTVASTTTTKTTLTTTTSMSTTTTSATKTTTTSTQTTTTSASTSTATCAWDGHCAGATCSTDDDCSDPWSCVSGICNYDPTAVCQWDDHCLDAVCTTDDDCSDPWACINGECAVDPNETCSWEGHCAGATCVVDDDCSDPYSCIYGVCA